MKIIVRILEMNIPPFPYTKILLKIQEVPTENMVNPYINDKTIAFFLDCVIIKLKKIIIEM